MIPVQTPRLSLLRVFRAYVYSHHNAKSINWETLPNKDLFDKYCVGQFNPDAIVQPQPRGMTPPYQHYYRDGFTMFVLRRQEQCAEERNALAAKRNEEHCALAAQETE